MLGDVYNSKAASAGTSMSKTNTELGPLWPTPLDAPGTKLWVDELGPVGYVSSSLSFSVVLRSVAAGKR